MENKTELLNNPPEHENTLTITHLASSYLSETGKWSKFLSILGFIAVGLMVIGGFFASTVISLMHPEVPASPISGVMFGFMYIAGALLYFFPIYFLFNFSTHIKKALAAKDNMNLDTAFRNLKRHYKFIGILMLIILGFYVIFGLGALIVGILA